MAEKVYRDVLLNPRARVALAQGVDQMANVLRVTLGPMARAVVMAPIISTRAPELLTDSATIARRIIELPDPYVNMGAMLIRHMAWRMREKVGNGAATAAVIAQALLHEANYQFSAGANVMMLKRGIERGLGTAYAELQGLARPMESPEQIEAMAIAAAAGDVEIGRYVAEMLEIIGTDGVILVEDHAGRKTDREYVEGLQWDSGYVSAYFCTDLDRMEAVVENPIILSTDVNVETAQQILPIMEVIMAKKDELGIGGFVLIANEISGPALAIMVANTEKKTLPCLGIKAPGAGDRRVRILEDVAVLTGGRMIAEDAGDTMEEAKLTDLGRSRRVWANRDFFSIVGGRGEPSAIRQRVQDIKKLLPSADGDYERDKMRERLGKLQGGVGILKVGAPSEREREIKKQRGEEAVSAARAAAEEGVVPGGGAAYIACLPALEALVAAITAESGTEGRDEALGVRVLMKALQAPTEWIVRNAAQDPRPILAQLRQSPAGHGFDVVSGKIMDMTEAGVLDPLKVIRTALETGTSTGMMALTTDALVLTAKRDPAINP
ncbi:MAG: chaperonin GroEL [Chloroflexota bacterium]|nr:chaperonin GroEL [Chloroflexota bacterium]